MGCAASAEAPAEAPASSPAAIPESPPLKQYLSDTKSNLDFNLVMKSECGAKAMLDFATSMMSEENTSFWIDATSWRRQNEVPTAMVASAGANGADKPEGVDVASAVSITSTIITDKDACTAARGIVAKYLAPGAELPVNLPGRITSRFKEQPSSCTLEMFDEAIKECTTVIKNDTFEVFSRSSSGFELAKQHPEFQK